MVAAVLARDRGIWATAVYAGLRRGELRALWASDIDLAAGVIRVERGYDMEGEISLKTTARRRRVPVAAVLRDRLIEHKLATAREGISSCSVAPPAMRLTARS